MNRLVSLVGSLRVLEALPFSGITVLGGLLAWREHGGTFTLAFPAAVVAVFLLACAVFAFNDLMDREDDRRSGLKPKRALVRGDFSVREASTLVTTLAAGGVILLGACAPWQVLATGLSMLPVGVSYSQRAYPLKAVPVLSSLAHVVFGLQTCLLGAWSVAGPEPGALAAALYFGLVFAAGHLHHEVADLDADRRAGVLTHAVRFGPRLTLAAGFVLFCVSGAYFSLLTVAGLVPAAAGWIQLGMLAGYLTGFYGILRGRFNPERMRRLRAWYRLVYVSGGLFMALALAM